LRSKWQEAAEFVTKFDVVAFSETKLDCSASNSSLMVPGYVLFRQDRNSRGGGVATYIKDIWTPTDINEIQEKYVLLGVEVLLTRLAMKKPTKRVILISTYRPPNAKAAWFENFNEMLLELLPIGLVIVLGDINADLLKPNIGAAKQLCQSLALAGLAIPSIFPTRICSTTATCLDIIAIPKEIDCSEYSIIANAASDHYPVSAMIRASTTVVLKPVKRRSYKHTDMRSLRQRAERIVLSPSPDIPVDELLATWQERITCILDEVAPIRSVPACRKTCKWLTADVRGLMQRRDAIARKISTNSTPELLAECKLLKRTVKSRMRRAAKEYGSTILAENDSSAAWKFIREVTFSTAKGESTLMDLTILNDHLAETVQKSGNVKHQLLETVEPSSSVPTPPTPQLNLVSNCDSPDSFSLMPLDSKEVFHLLNSLKTKTAMGHDELPASLLKQLAPSIADNLTRIMNCSLTQGIVPKEWKKANVAAIWKTKGSKTDPSNYRPISVLPVIARIFEKAVAKQLTQYCTARETIPPEQFGFRAKSSCEIALLVALDIWMAEVDRGKVVGALLIDLSKAFDSVPHQRLLLDLQEIGCGGEVIKWFHSYLSDRKQRVTKGPEVTEWKTVSRGVPQGSCLSPTLFNIYVRQLPSATQSSTMQFADDVTNSESDVSELTVIKKLEDSFQHTKTFCEERELIINAAKTQFILFKAPSKKLHADLEIVIDQCSIKPLDHVKLLGVTLDHHFTFAMHMEKTTKKCAGVLGALKRAAPHLPKPLLRNAYVAMVRSHLEYSSAVFASASKSQLRKLDTVQKIGSRIICGVPRNAHSAPLLESLQLDSLEDRRAAHVRSIVKSILDKNTHPALMKMFHCSEDGTIGNSQTARTVMGRRRFSIYAKDSANG
jgi:Reverse transcriptase (RNA-dependent DNA polymerase)